jgi:hypothetical protein
VSDPLSHHPAAEALAALAARYTAALDAGLGASAGDLLRAVHPLLAQLYAAGVVLPDARPTDGPDLPDRRALEQERRQALGALLGGRCFYREVFDAYDFVEEPVVGDLSDDLAAVERELREGLDLWQVGRARDAVWAWQFSFETHWSEHATSALRAIRTLAYVYDLDGPPPARQADV